MPPPVDEAIRKAFTELVEPHEAVLFAGALRFTGNRADAEDLLQETYMKAYVGFTRSQEIENARAWLFKIMRNAYINRYHRSRRRPVPVAYDEGLDGKIRQMASSRLDDPEQRFFSQLLDSEVEQALDSIPEQFRESVILCDISGLTYEEISQVLDCPLGTVRSRISRGRELLFGKLHDYARQKGLLPKGEKGRSG